MRSVCVWSVGAYVHELVDLPPAVGAGLQVLGSQDIVVELEADAQRRVGGLTEKHTHPIRSQACELHGIVCVCVCLCMSVCLHVCVRMRVRACVPVHLCVRVVP